MTREYIPTNWNIIIPAILLACTTVVSTMAGVYMAKVSATVDKVHAEVVEVKRDVNSTASALAVIAKEKDARLEQLEKELAAAKARGATLEERSAERDRPRK